jgi:hypothetical protein
MILIIGFHKLFIVNNWAYIIRHKVEVLIDRFELFLLIFRSSLFLSHYLSKLARKYLHYNILYVIYKEFSFENFYADFSCNYDSDSKTI